LRFGLLRCPRRTHRTPWRGATAVRCPADHARHRFEVGLLFRPLVELQVRQGGPGAFGWAACL